MPLKKGCPRHPASGRKKGVGNKNTQLIRDAIVKALDEVGGYKYLVWLAKENSSAFSSLVAKVLPTQLTGPNDGPVEISTMAAALREIDGQSRRPPE